MAHVKLPDLCRRGQIPVHVVLANSKGTQGRFVLRAVPALIENHSIAVSFVQNYRTDIELCNFRAEFVELGQNQFGVQCLHGMFRSLVKVDTNSHE